MGSFQWAEGKVKCFSHVLQMQVAFDNLMNFIFIVITV